MSLQDILFGTWVPPEGAKSRFVSHDDGLMNRNLRESYKDSAKLASKRRVEVKNTNTERIKDHLKRHPWCTAQDIGKALNLSKTPVYKNLVMLRDNNQVEVNSRRNGIYTIITYKWKGGA